MLSVRMRLPFVVAVMLALVTGCGGDGEEADSVDTGSVDTMAGSTSGEGSSSQAAAPSGSGGGTLTLGDEVITLERARCHLQEQDVSGSPGKILFTGQGFGTTGTGEEFVLDVSRYNEDSMFTGDDIQVDVGDPFGADFYSWDASADLGTIEQDGSTLRADGLTFLHSEDFTEVAGAFELDC